MGDFKPVVTVTTENSLFVCSFKYDPHIVQILRDFPGRCYIPEKKIWTIPAKYITQEDITKKLSIAAYVKFEKPNNYGIHDNEIQKCKQLMIRKRFSKHTIKSYLFHINRFLEQSPKTSNHAEDTVIIYIDHIAGEEKKSSSYQNLAVNAIKFYFEGQTGGPYTIRSIQVIFHDACKKAGITKKATVHTLRHSYATHLLEKGTDIRIIQELLGHNSSKTTEIYTHVSNKLISRVVSPFDELDCV